MHINIKTTNLELEAGTSDYLEKRMKSAEKFLKGMDPSSVRADIELGRTTNHHRSGDVFRAEINLHASGNSFRAVSEKEDLFTAIDDARDELVGELSRQKRKKISSLRRGGQKVKSFIKGFWPRK